MLTWRRRARERGVKRDIVWGHLFEEGAALPICEAFITGRWVPAARCRRCPWCEEKAACLK